jgi:hypothetical protein
MRDVLLHVGAGGVARFDKLVEVALDLPPGHRPVALAEVGPDGHALDPVVPYQYDDAASGGRPRLTFMMCGETAREAERCYRATIGSGPQPPADSLVRVSAVEDWQGQPSFRIETPAATYVYHRYGGGFASLIDPEGNDWISYRPTGGSAGHYRGIPNLGVCGHPGYTNAETRVLAAGPLVATLASETRDGLWAFTWDVCPACARLTLTRAAGPYWFLYEGTPAGCFDPPAQFCVRASGIVTPLSEVWSESLPAPKWAAFGDARANRSLCLVRHDAGDEPDQYWPMEGNMTVFGFGRIYRTTERFLRRVPARFTISLLDGFGPEDARRVSDSAIHDLLVRTSDGDSHSGALG